MDIISDGKMSSDTHAAAYGAIAAYHCASRYSNAAGYGCVFPYMNIVGNLNLIIQLDAIFYPGILDSSPVDSGIGANFDIVSHYNAPDLRHFYPFAILFGQPKAIRPDNSARLNNAAFPHRTVGTNEDSGDEAGVVADPCARLNDTTGTNHYVFPDATTGADIGKRTNMSAGRYFSFGMNNSAGMYACFDGWIGIEQSDGAGECGVRIAYNQRRCGAFIRPFFVDEDSSGTRALQSLIMHALA